MKMRLSVNERGELVQRDGTVVGSISAITVELDSAALGTTGASRGEGKAQEKAPAAPTLDGMPDAEVEDDQSDEHKLWEHWCAESGRKQRLDSTMRGLLRNALKVRDLETCMRAVTGLCRDPWWRENRPRLELRYALRGNRAKAESDQDRIDKMAEKVGELDALSPIQRKLSEMPEGTRRQMGERMTRVRRAIGSQHDATRRAGAEALTGLQRHGIDVIVTPERKFGGWVVKS